MKPYNAIHDDDNGGSDLYSRRDPYGQMRGIS